MFTAGVVLPHAISSCRYFHRSLNPKKLIAIGFSHQNKKLTMSATIKLYALPEKVRNTKENKKKKKKKRKRKETNRNGKKEREKDFDFDFEILGCDNWFASAGTSRCGSCHSAAQRLFENFSYFR